MLYMIQFVVRILDQQFLILILPPPAARREVSWFTSLDPSSELLTAAYIRQELILLIYSH